MARSNDYNPKAPIVARKSSGLSLGGRRYEMGQPIDDDCVSVRKRMQLYKQNLVCHPWELSESAKPAEEQEEGLTETEKTADAEAEASRAALEAEGKETTEDADPAILDPEVADEDVNPEADNGDDETSEEEESENQEGEGESSAPASKKKRRKKKSS